MSRLKSSDHFNKLRKSISQKVRDLRKERHLTQAELAAQLGLSQERLSEVELGRGSFTAEQLLLILRLFNVTASHFAPPTDDHEAQLQNALARLGATHLHESADVVPSERLHEVGEVVRETLLAGAPRHLTALAPVIVRNIDRVNLHRLHADLARTGLERRLAWVADNILEAIRRELQGTLPRPLVQRYKRAEVVLAMFVDSNGPLAGDSSQARGARPLDLLDGTIGSLKTSRQTAEASSEISKRWGIVTELLPEDFVEALRATHA